MFVRLLALALAATVEVTTPVAAEDSQAPKADDPNERICEDVSMIGSRLAKKRICATRAEWADRKRQDRQAVERVQTQIFGPCQTINTKSGPPAC